MSTHDLADFMKAATRQMAEEYRRIQKRATEDPGTAGDQGEENWATILRGWLPSNMHVITKGRILSDKGVASPQVDIIVLSPEYPRHLLDKKLYLAGGVIAAFECKNTLKSQHIKSFISNSQEIKEHTVKEEGTPYKELHSSIIYGLLAHSHSWHKPTSKPVELITNRLLSFDEELIKHPRQMPDIVCVADLACWTTSKTTYIGPRMGSLWHNGLAAVYGQEGCACAYYDCHSEVTFGANEDFTAIGTFIYSLIFKMSKNIESLRPLAKYYSTVLFVGSEGIGRSWPATIYSESIRQAVQSGFKLSLEPYNEWGLRMA